LGLADAVTTANAALGFVAVVAATIDVHLAARLILLAAIADAIDGILARTWGGSEIGEYLDSLADVASFGVAPALVVVEASAGLSITPLVPTMAVGVLFGAAFVAMAVVRLALYTALDTADAYTDGVQTTLAATILSVGFLAGVPAWILFWSLGVFAVLMVVPIRYPDLRVRDALIMGAIQALAVFLPRLFQGIFPKVLLAWALGYLVLAPWLYPGAEGKRS
jgi:CDP-diacylglycerol--serine O-phosphatidyltransferase